MTNFPKCLGCEYPLQQETFVRVRGQNYLPTFYCNNHKCHRYGLLSVLKVAGTGEEAENE